jgi:hypothetical protein
MCGDREENPESEIQKYRTVVKNTDLDGNQVTKICLEVLETVQRKVSENEEEVTVLCQETHNDKLTEELVTASRQSLYGMCI